MSDPYLTDCQNCGRQIFLYGDDPEEKCYWCGKPALKKKEENMLEKEEPKTTITPPDVRSELPPVPPAPKSRQEHLNDARKLRGKKCLTCEEAYQHDGIKYCPEKRCPSRLPKGNRLPYRRNGKPIVKESLPAAPASEPEKENKSKSTAHYICLGKYEVVAGLPAFPAFNEAWPDGVKIAWFNVFRELYSYDTEPHRDSWLNNLFKRR